MGEMDRIVEKIQIPRDEEGVEFVEVNVDTTRDEISRLIGRLSTANSYYRRLFNKYPGMMLQNGGINIDDETLNQLDSSPFIGPVADLNPEAFGPVVIVIVAIAANLTFPTPVYGHLEDANAFKNFLNECQEQGLDLDRIMDP